MNQIKTGILLSYISILIVNIAGLLTTPIIVKTLGAHDYGLYILICSIVAYITLVDLGVATTINRFVAKYRVLGDKKGEELFIGSIFKVIIFIIFIIFIIAYTITLNIDIFLTSKQIDRDLFIKIFLILTSSLVFNILTAFINGYLSAYEKFVYIKSLAILKSVLRILILFLIFSKIGSILFLVIIDIILSIFMFFCSLIYFIKIYKGKFFTRENDNNILKEVFKYSGWVFVFSCISQMQWHSGQLIIGSKIDTVAVGIYAIGIILGTYYSAFSDAITNVFISRTTKIIYSSENYLISLNEYMIKISRICLGVLLLILGGFILNGKKFINLWVGDDYEKSWLIALIIMVIYTIPLSQGIANQVLEIKKMFYFKSKIYLIFISLGVFMGYHFIEYYGILGMILGIAFGWIIAISIMTNYYHNYLKLNMFNLFKKVKNILLVFFFSTAFGYIFSLIYKGDGWFGLFINCGFYAFIYLSFIYIFVLSNAEKLILKKKIGYE
ncbi:oligosaccharide flippase family protein [Acinetobacter pseudolwoffii]|uniref:lipopolysaccharide biosynthesis protein n=1 Tax=Acinetobacter pseudolwoffii TaxID=2053287 RepID=UPI002576E228|nr:oligosaccharide flippase family protein [Acinetobacter pseudolwoffii]MDM1335778.1 oligosaccharide flippase family protein [Acinetobacter pseudolwoffii]